MRERETNERDCEEWVLVVDERKSDCEEWILVVGEKNVKQEKRPIERS